MHRGENISHKPLPGGEILEKSTFLHMNVGIREVSSKTAPWGREQTSSLSWFVFNPLQRPQLFLSWWLTSLLHIFEASEILPWSYRGRCYSAETAAQVWARGRMRAEGRGQLRWVTGWQPQSKASPQPQQGNLISCFWALHLSLDHFLGMGKKLMPHFGVMCLISLSSIRYEEVWKQLMNTGGFFPLHVDVVLLHSVCGWIQSLFALWVFWLLQMFLLHSCFLIKRLLLLMNHFGAKWMTLVFVCILV